MHNMTETVESVCAHPVLRTLPAAGDMMRKYSNTRQLIQTYEETMRAVWMNQNVSRRSCILLIITWKLHETFFFFIMISIKTIFLINT